MSNQVGLTASVGKGEQADGFGMFGYELSFRPSSTWLSQGNSATAILNYTGSISDTDLLAISIGGEENGHVQTVLDWKPIIAGSGGRVNTGFESGSGSTVPVPEPSSMAIAGLGALGFVAYGLRRRLKK